MRVLQKAALSLEIFCPFFLMSPDFEFGNFSAVELLDIAILIGRVSQSALDANIDLKEKILLTQSNKEFFNAIARIETSHGSKDERWGAVLMAHALRHPTFPMEHRLAGQVRPIVEAANLMHRARTVGYVRSVKSSIVDPETGRVSSRRSV